MQSPDLITAKLPALLRLPAEPEDAEAAEGQFRPGGGGAGRPACSVDEAKCASCHPAPLYTDIGTGQLHDPASRSAPTSIYASRSATGQYRATPLRALWQHPPYFHDGSAPDLPPSSSTTSVRCL